MLLAPSQKLYTIGDDVEYRERLRVKRKGFKLQGGVVFGNLSDTDKVVELFCEYWGHEDPAIYGVFQLITDKGNLEPWPEKCRGLYRLRWPCEFVLPGEDREIHWLRYWIRVGLLILAYKI